MQQHTSQEALISLRYDAVLDAVARHASTEYGRRRIQALRPNPAYTSLHQEFDRIESLLGAVQRGETLSFSEVRDVAEALRRAETEGAALDPDPIVDIAGLARAARRLKLYIGKRRESFAPLMLYADALEEMPGLEKEVERAIDENEREVRDDASPELKRIRRAIAGVTQKTRKKLDELIRRHAEILLESAYTVRDGRYVLAVRQQHRGRVRGIVHGSSASGGTVFVEPDELVALGNELRDLAGEEEVEVRRILVALTDVVREHLDALHAAEDAVGLLDSLQARAYFADEVGAMRPGLSEGALVLVEARHPLLLLRKGLKGTVPLNLKLSTDSHVLVITGPNAGGKTVALKTVGLITAMVHAGIWPPVGDGTLIPPLELWHVIIGDEQSLEGDLSSFSGHLEKLKRVHDDPDRAKLVLVDEIASGTDPAEGGALAMAFLDDALKRGWWTLVTTHIGALKAYAHETEGVRNGSMQFDRRKLTPTYRFQPDLPGSSYALEIAGRVGMPSDLIDNARRRMGEERLRLEDLIEELSGRLAEVQNRERELSLRSSETAALERMLRERLDTLEARRAEKMDRAAAEAEKLLEEANRAIEMAVKDIRESQASREAIRRAHELVKQRKQELDRTRDEARAAKKKAPKEPAKDAGKKQHGSAKPARTPSEPAVQPLEGPIEVGDEVRLESGMTGEVLALQGNRAQVAAGAVKLWTDRGSLEKVRTNRADTGGVNVHVGSSAEDEAPISTEIQLRGMRVEEAEAVLEKYLEDLALSGLGWARIVHGKGTGALRAMVTEKLKRHPLVKNWRIGEPHEGGDGVTVVELAG